MKKRNEDRIVNGYQLTKGQPWYAAIGSNVDPRCFNIIFHNMVNVFFHIINKEIFHSTMKDLMNLSQPNQRTGEAVDKVSVTCGGTLISLNFIV